MTTIAPLKVLLDEFIAAEVTMQQRPRLGYAEIAVTDAKQPYLVRWIAANEEQVWRTSENYTNLSDAVHAIALLPGGIDWLISYTPRLVDERTPGTEAPDPAPSDPGGFDMNPE